MRAKSPVGRARRTGVPLPGESRATTGPSAAGHGFGTAPVFLASISTILGAILFLRFGYAVGHIGLWGTIMIIAIGHLVTIPTVLAVSEIATNRRVAGGGAYFIISRSFGTTIGGSIGIALYLSQAISIAFYLVAFAEAFQPVLEWVGARLDVVPTLHAVSVPGLIILVALMLTKGADQGVRVLWVVCGVLALVIGAFLVGSGPEEIRPDGLNVTSTIANPDAFGVVFATCFPAFTGMIAGLGLSGDLKDPKRSIPMGTIGATLAGMVIYSLVAIKLAQSATPEALAEDQFIMARIALWGPSIYIGLAAAAFSSALGSVMVAPRTLQALARDSVFPAAKFNTLLASGRGEAGEPVNATYVSVALAAVFVALGDIDFIAQILSMFFMVTYGTLCSVSFLEYFAGNPSYRPTFRSRWYISLVGAVMCVLMMVQMSALYALLAMAIMLGIYLGLKRSRRGERDLTAILQGTMFQLVRRLQITLQKSQTEPQDGGWRPSFVALTQFGDRRVAQFDLLRWICHRHGFGHFVQHMKGKFSLTTELEARAQLSKLVRRSDLSRAGTFVDTLVAPSFENAVTQALQYPGISGLPNNSILLEFDQGHPEEIPRLVDATRLAVASGFNAVVLRSSAFRFGYRSSIHVWLTRETLPNAAMMLMLAYIIVGHPEWRTAEIRVFACVGAEGDEREADRLSALVDQGRLPIGRKNIETLPVESQAKIESEVGYRSSDADLVIAGISAGQLKEDSLAEVLQSYKAVNDIIFMHAVEEIVID
ncbi:MAG: amino acid permease [Bryobacterales bacterium]|nr:amino acid permease [Bryobacterales bacterium]